MGIKVVQIVLARLASSKNQRQPDGNQSIPPRAHINEETQDRGRTVQQLVSAMHKDLLLTLMKQQMYIEKLEARLLQIEYVTACLDDELIRFTQEPKLFR